MVFDVGRRRAGGIALGFALLAAASPAATGVQAAQTPTWVTTQGKVVNLTLIAGYNATNAGFNFNGAAHGQMVVTVPLGDKVVASFANKAQGAAHDVVIVPYTTTLPGGNFAPAFAGAASPVPRFGPGRPAAGAQTFSFTANKAGTYMIVCGISGHALAGMWDTLVVSASATTASVAFNKAGVSNVTGTSAPPANAPMWVSTSGRTVKLSLISGWNNDNAGFNFNGAAYGQMVVTVPLGDTIVVTYKNNVPVFHDVDIINYMQPLPSHSATPAFAGSRSPLPSFRPGRSGSGGPPSQPRAPVTFTFTASKAGKYMIICGVPGHALAGMWDTLVVSATATTASVTYTQ